MEEQLKDFSLNAQEDVEEKTHDDVINEEIEQEHKCECCKCREDEPTPEIQKLYEEKIKDKNQYAMRVHFNLQATMFVDIKDFNNKTYFPDEITEKKEEYIRKNSNEKLEKIIKELREVLEKHELCPSSLTVTARPNLKSNEFKELLKDLLD